MDQPCAYLYRHGAFYVLIFVLNDRYTAFFRAVFFYKNFKKYLVLFPPLCYYNNIDLYGGYFMIVQRLWPDDKYDGAFYDDFIERIAKHKGCCDEVWMCTLSGMPALSTHKAFAEKLSGYAEKLRAAGIAVSLQVGRTIGHWANENFSDYSGQPEDANFTVNLSGKTEEGFYCARSEGFRNYFEQVCRIYCETLHPQSIYFDDDLRLRAWDGNMRCACPNCLKAFNERYKTKYASAEELGKAVKEDGETRKNFLAFSYGNLAEFTERISRACAAGYPDVIVGLQHGGYSGELNRHLFAAIKRSGAKAIGSRSGAGAYTDDAPAELVKKANELECQLSRVPDFVTHRCPEIEGYPHVYFNKSAHGFLMESVIDLAQGFNFLSFAAFCGNYEKQLFEEFNRKFSKNRSYLERLVAANNGTYRLGIRNFIPERYFLTDDDYPSGALTAGRYMCPQFYYGLPVTYDMRGKGALYLDHRLVNILTESEIDMLLKNPVITSGRAIIELQKRGFGDKTGVRAEPINGGYYEEEIFGYGKNNVTFLCGDCTVLYGDVKAISRYAPHSEMGIVKPQFRGGGIASCITETACGGKWLVLGYAPENTKPSLAKAQSIADAVNEIAALPVKIGASRLLQYPRGNEKGVSAVTFLNASVEKSAPTFVSVVSAAGKRFIWQAQDEDPVALHAVIKGGIASVTLPELAGWTAGTLFTEE